MPIESMTSGNTNPAGGPRVDQSGSNPSAWVYGQVRRETPDFREAGSDDDSVWLSAGARGSRAAETTSPSGLSAERLREILKRLANGYYDRPMVVDRVAERVKDDLTAPGPVA